MSKDPAPPEDAIRSDDTELHGDVSRVLLFMQAGRDRELILNTLSKQYQVETTTDVETLEDEFDCCVFDTHEFNRVAGTLQSYRDTSSPVFLPFVLLGAEDSINDMDAEVWEYVDDIIELPVNKAALVARIENLVQRRRTAIQLAEREAQLETTINDLKLKEQAMDEAPIGITITELAGKDNPIKYANAQFENLTGYSSELLGTDCRFLQGEETDASTRSTIREAIDSRESVSVDILNYRKNDQKFWNKLDIAPIRDEEGTVTNFVGFQTDITDRKIRERRLEVLNRVLSHNLRNKMNVIDGHAELLQAEYEDEEVPESFTIIKETASDLIGLAEAVQEIERTLSTSVSTGPAIALNDRMEQLMSAFKDRYPAVTFDLTLPHDSSCEVAITGLMTAIEEAIENAVEHNDTSDPVVKIRVKKQPDDWVEIDIEDNGPGIPDQEISVLGAGESSLNHADRLGIWLMYWVVSKAGGNFSVSDAEPRGTILTLSVPTHT